MNKFDQYYAEAKAAKIKAVKEFKKSKKRTNTLDALCKGLEVFSKVAVDGTLERFIRSHR